MWFTQHTTVNYQRRCTWAPWYASQTTATRRISCGLNASLHYRFEQFNSPLLTAT